MVDDSEQLFEMVRPFLSRWKPSVSGSGQSAGLQVEAGGAMVVELERDVRVTSQHV